MSENPTALRHRFFVMISCPSLRLSEIVIVDAADEGEAQPAAIAACDLPLKGEWIDFTVRRLGPAARETT